MDEQHDEGERPPLQEVSPRDQRRMIQCDHGFHHHHGPHACDWRSHDDNCPFWAAIDTEAAERAEEQADVAAFDEAKAADDGLRLSIEDVFSDLG